MVTQPEPVAAIYDATAPVYDVLTAHHRYDDWTDLLERVLRPHGLLPRGRLLDVGCGTGKSFGPWEARGWRVLACDCSPAMLDRAAAKAASTTKLRLADARRLGRLGSFDLVTMTDDVVNYIEPDDLVPAFRGVARNLAPEGLLAFDVNTLDTYRTFFAGTELHEADGAFVVWRGTAPSPFEPGGEATAALVGFVRDDAGCWTRTDAVHQQRHHPVERLDAALASAGLSLLGVYGTDDDGNFDDRLDESRHSKAVLVAGHAAP